MKSVKAKPQPQLSSILLLLGVISALFVLFSYTLSHGPDKEFFPTYPPVPTVKPVLSTQELDNMLVDLNKEDTSTQINSELQKLSSDASGI